MLLLHCTFPNLPCWFHRGLSPVLDEACRMPFHLEENAISTKYSLYNRNKSEIFANLGDPFLQCFAWINSWLTWTGSRLAFKSHKLDMDQWQTSFWLALLIIMQAMGRSFSWSGSHFTRDFASGFLGFRVDQTFNLNVKLFILKISM